MLLFLDEVLPIVLEGLRGWGALSYIKLAFGKKISDIDYGLLFLDSTFLSLFVSYLVLKEETNPDEVDGL